MTSGESRPPSPDAGQSEDRARSAHRFLGLRTSGAVLAAVIGVVVNYLAFGNLVAAGSDVITLAPTFVWAIIGPHLVVLCLLAALLCLPLWLARHRQRLQAVATGLVAVALVASVTIVTIMVTAVTREGGSVDLIRALTLSTPSAAPDEVTSYVTVDGEEQEARVYVPPGGAQGAPVLMYIHGGGWYMGSAKSSDTTARWYASRGWYVVNVDYRLATNTRPTWDKAPLDVACALTWTVDRAEAAGADPERLTVLGDSAGGHLALLLGWSASERAASSSCPDAGAVPVPDAVAAGYPVGDISYTYDHATAPLGVDPQEFTRTFLGGAPAAQPERLETVSPSTYLSASVPPSLIVQPERDDFIPAEGNYRLAEAAELAGADMTLVKVPFAYHVFDAFPGSLGGQVKSSVVVDWLDGLGLAP